MSAIEHTLWITEKTNEILGPIAVNVFEFLNKIGLKFSYNKEMPLPDHLIVSWIIMIIVLVIALITRRKLDKDKPPVLQHIWEAFSEVVIFFIDNVIGKEKGRKFFPLLATLSIFILFANLAGLFPFLISPTSNLNTTVACAILAFLYYNYQGIRTIGLKNYVKHFTGPYLFLAPLMVPIELLSHLSRILSLSVRLFGNIFGEDVVIIILFFLSPIFVPVPMMGFAIFTSLIQTFIFVMLTMMYLSGAVSEEH